MPDSFDGFCSLWPGADLGGRMMGMPPPTQGRRENFRAPGQKIRLGPLVSGAPKTHD